MRSRIRRSSVSVLIGVSVILAMVAGCTPTYPKEKIKESIIRICKKEYSLDVKVGTMGKTIAIYVPLENLIDFTFSVSKSASEKINDVILSVSRVALSTNAQYDFYCVIAHDVRMPEIQIVIIKSVDDVKRFLLNDISRGEYSKRMIVDIRLSPQAQKERAIKDVFERMSLDKRWQEEVMNDFFRSEPAGLGDIGYWSGNFYIKDVGMPEFLAEQIASRIRIEFREVKALADALTLRMAKCAFASRAGKSLFKAEVLAENKMFGDPSDDKASDMVLEEVIRIASIVIRNYRFEGFDYFEIADQRSRVHIKATKGELEAYRKKKIVFKDMGREEHD